MFLFGSFQDIFLFFLVFRSLIMKCEGMYFSEFTLFRFVHFFFPLDLCVLSDLGLCQPLIFQVFFFSPSLFLVSTWDFSGTYDRSFVIAPYIPDVPYFIFLINFSLCSDWIFSVDLSLYLLISPLLLSPCCY